MGPQDPDDVKTGGGFFGFLGIGDKRDTGPQAPPDDAGPQDPDAMQDVGKSSILRRGIADPLVSATKGAIIGFPEVAVGLSNLATGGLSGRATDFVTDKLSNVTQPLLGVNVPKVHEILKTGNEFFESQLSPETQLAKQKVAEAQGFFPTLGEYIENPSTIVSGLAENVPGLLGIKALGKVALKTLGKDVLKGKPLEEALAKVGGRITAGEKSGEAATLAGENLLKKNAALAATGAAVGEGLYSAGQNISQSMQNLNTDVMTPLQLAQIGVTGLTTGLISKMSGGLANRMGIPDPDIMLQGVTSGNLSGVKNMLLGVLGAAITEGALEELPQSAIEKWGQNLAEGRPPFEGVAEAGASGLLIGAIMGMGGAAGAKLQHSYINSDKAHQEIDSQLKELDPEGALNVAKNDTVVGERTAAPVAEQKVFEELTPEKADTMDWRALQTIIWHGSPAEQQIAQEALERKPKPGDSSQLHTVQVQKDETMAERGERIAKFGRSSKPPMVEVQLNTEEFAKYKQDAEAKRIEKKKLDAAKRLENFKNLAKEKSAFHQKMQELDENSALRQVLERIHEQGLASKEIKIQRVGESTKGNNFLQTGYTQVIPGHDENTTNDIRKVLESFGFKENKINKKGRLNLDELADELNNQGTEAPPHIPGEEYTGQWDAKSLIYLLRNANSTVASKTSAQAEASFLEKKIIDEEAARKAELDELLAIPEGEMSALQMERLDELAPKEDLNFSPEEIDNFDFEDVPFKSSSLYGRVNARLGQIYRSLSIVQKSMDENPSPELKAQLETRYKELNEEKDIILDKQKRLTRGEESKPAVGRNPAKKSGDDNAIDFLARMDETPDHLTADQVVSVFEQFTGGPFVYKWLSPLLNKYNVAINFDWKGEKLNDDDYAQYNPNSNLITFGSIDMFKKSDKGAHRQFATTFAHEAIHAIIHNALKGNTQASTRLKSRLEVLRQELIAYHQENGGGEYISSIINLKVGELAAYGFTDETLAKWMNGIEGKAKGETGTLWDRFKKIILDFIGTEANVGPTKLDELSSILDEVVGIKGVSDAIRLQQGNKQEQGELFKHGAFHGGKDVRKSPEGKLSLKHTREGTGGMLQGYGLYFADLREVAEYYKTEALYKVELAPKEDEYMLWDEPFSRQSDKVKQILNKIGYEEDSPETGEQIYKQLMKEAEYGWYWAKGKNFTDVRADQAASEYLYSLGIRGNKYRDANSRAAVVTAYYKSEGKKHPLGHGDTVAEAKKNIDPKWFGFAEKGMLEIKYDTKPLTQKRTYNYVLFSDLDVEITDIFTSLKGIDKRVLSQKLIEGSLSPEDIKTYETQISNRLLEAPVKGEGKKVSLFRKTLQKIGAQYERTIGTNRERGFYNLPQTRERQGRAVDTQKSAIMAAGVGRFPIDFVEILQKERLINEVILGLEQEKDNIISGAKKAGRFSILQKDVKGRVRVKQIDKTISDLKKSQKPTFVHSPEGYKNKDFARANELARENGYELIPIKDHTGFVNAFINRATKQIFGETVNEHTIFQLIGHELSHVGVKGVASNKETQMLIDPTTAAFVTYRGELERSFGRKMKLEKVLSEYAADLQGGFEENYGVKLKEGLLPGARVEVISKTAEYEQISEALPFKKEEVNTQDLAALNEALIEDVDTKKNIALKNGLISMMQTMKPFLNTAPQEIKDIYNKIKDFREFAVQGLLNKNFAGWLNSVVDYSSRWKGEKAEFKMRSNAITGKEEPMRMETLWNSLERKRLEELGTATTTRTKLDALTDLLNKTLPNAWAQTIQEEEAIAEAKKYDNVDAFIKAVSYVPTNKTRTVKDVQVRVFVNKNGKEWNEPVAFGAANLNNVGNAVADDFKEVRKDLYKKGWRQPSMYLRNVQLRQIWKTAHGVVAQTKRDEINRTYTEQQVKNAERKLTGPAPREGKQGGKERSISRAADGISLSKRKVSVGIDTGLQGKESEVAIEALDKSLRPYARALANAKLSSGKESDKIGLREKIHVGLMAAIDELYVGNDDALMLSAETYADVLRAVEQAVGMRNEEFVLTKKEEEDLEKAYVEIEAKRAAQKMAIKAGMPVREIVIPKETLDIPSEKSLDTNQNIIRRGNNEIGLIAMEDLGNYIELQKLDINRKASIKDVLAAIFKSNENAGSIRYEMGTHWSPKQRAAAQDLGSILLSLGAEFNFTENGSEYILNRDAFGAVLEKGIMPKEEPAQAILKQKKQEQGNLFGIVEQTKKDALDIMKNEADYAAVKDWLEANAMELNDEGEILNKNGEVIGVDEMMEKGLSDDAVDALYDIDMSWKWHPVNLPGKVDSRLSKLFKGGWVSALSEMASDEAQKFSNQVDSYGGIKHRTARKIFSLPYQNTVKSGDWKRVYHILGELRVEHRERLTHKWIMKAQKYLNRRKYFKEAGYSNKERNDADYRIGRIVTIGDANLVNVLFDLEKQVADIDKQMEQAPLLRKLASLDQKRADLQARIDRYNNDRAYSFEETQDGIKDDDGTLVKLNGKNAKLEYEMYRAIRSAEDSIFETTLGHMKNMLMAQYRNQKWFKVFSAAIGQDLSDTEAHGLVDKLQGVSTIPGISRITAANRREKGKKVTDADISIKLGEIFRKINITYDTFTDTTDVVKKYERLQSQLTKEMKALRDYVAELYGVEPTEKNLLGEKKYAEIDQAVKEMFIAYQRTRPRLKQISALRNDWKRWPAFFPRKREQGLMKFQMFENQVDPTTGVITKKEIYSGQFNSKAEGALLYAKIVDKYGKNGELDNERYSFSYPAVVEMPEGSFDGIRDFNVQALIDAAFENMEMKGDFFDSKGKPVDLKGQVWDAAYEAIAGQYQARGASAHGIKRKQKPGEQAIKGYLEEGHDQILLGHITSMAGLLTKQEAALNVMDVMNKLEDKTRAPELREYIQGQLRNDNKWDRISSKLRSLAFVWYLGAMVKSAAVNSTQPYIVGVPMLDNYIREKKIKTSGTFQQMKASKDIAINGGILFKDPSEWGELKGVTGIEQRFLEEGVESGSMAAQLARFIKGQTSDWGRVWNKTFDYLAMPFASVERYNRFSSGLAMFRVAYNYHLQHMGKGDVEGAFELALEDAKTFINNVHYPIGKHNLPILAQGGDLASVTMKTAYIFRPFTHNFLLNQFNLLRSAAKLAGPERSDLEIRQQATNDLKTFIHTMALVALFGGLMGLPFLKDIFDWYEKHFGYSPKQWVRETLRGIGGDTLETFGMSGLPAVLGGNISGSLSIGIPFVNTNPESIFGVYAGLVQKAGKAGEAAMRGDPYRMVTNLTPEFLRNPIVALTESDFGHQTLGTRGFATTPQGMPSYATTGKPLALTGGEVAWKTLGFQPTRYAKEREIEQTVKSQVLWAKESKKRISETFRIDRLQKDPNALKTMMSSVRELNTKIKAWKIPETPARMSTIIKNSRETKNLQKRRELKRRSQLMES